MRILLLLPLAVEPVDLLRAKMAKRHLEFPWRRAELIGPGGRRRQAVGILLAALPAAWYGAELPTLAPNCGSWPLASAAHHGGHQTRSACSGTMSARPAMLWLAGSWGGAACGPTCGQLAPRVSAAAALRSSCCAAIRRLFPNIRQCQRTSLYSQPTSRPWWHSMRQHPKPTCGRCCAPQLPAAQALLTKVQGAGCARVAEASGSMACCGQPPVLLHPSGWT